MISFILCVVLHSVCINLQSYWQRTRISTSFPVSISCLLLMGLLTSIKWYITMVLICSSNFTYPKYFPITPTPQKILTQKDIFTLICRAALFIIAKTWKQPKCLLMDKETIYIHICAAINNEKSPTICYHIDGFWKYWAKWNQSNRERRILEDLRYM